MVNTSREMYFATCQALAEDEVRPGLYRRKVPEILRSLRGIEVMQSALNQATPAHCPRPLTANV